MAAGLGTPPLVEKLGVGVPLRDKEGTLTVLTQPMPRLLQHIVVTGKNPQRDVILHWPAARPLGVVVYFVLY